MQRKGSRPNQTPRKAHNASVEPVQRRPGPESQPLGRNRDERVGVVLIGSSEATDRSRRHVMAQRKH